MFSFYIFLGFFFLDKHISIQRHLADLEKLADLREGEFSTAVSQNTDLHITGIYFFF